MSNALPIIVQFEKRVFDESYKRIFKCLSLISEEQLWDQNNEAVPAIGSFILHLCGNARQWILSTLGDVPDNRQRNSEFLIHKNIKKSDLVFLLENLKVNLRQTINELTEEDLNHVYSVNSFRESGFSVLVHVIEHFSYHTGQITCLTKLATNKPTNFYEGFNLDQTNNLN
jgi:uncharacterized damage-inducible protein DinB